jgi:hypothetical protein
MHYDREEREQKKMKDGMPASMLRSQKGIALVVVLVMLALLGMLGAFALNNSNTEMHIAGNYRNEQIAFNNCNQVEAFGPNNQLILNTIVPYVVNSYPTGTGFQKMIPGVYALPAGAQGETWVRVEFVCAGPPSIAKAQDQEAFLDYHFLVTVVGRGANNSECVVESEVVQTGPRPAGIDPDC